MASDLRKIVKAIEAQDFTVTRTKRGHYEVSRDGRRITTISGTPSDWRSTLNSLAPLKRAGFVWPPKR